MGGRRISGSANRGRLLLRLGAAVFANLARKIAILAFCRAKLRENGLLYPASKRSPRDSPH